MRRTATGIDLGLHRHRSHDIVDLRTCEVLHPALVALLAPLHASLRRCDLLRRAGAVIANRLDDGIDLLLRTDAAASSHDRSRLAAFADANDVSRIAHAIGEREPETLVMHRRPSLTLSGVRVHPPPGAFLQATAHGEAAILAAVVAGLPPFTRKSRIAELFSGIGTLTFALARHAAVHAYEGDQAAYTALNEACRAATLTGRIIPQHRDLSRRPLMAAELATYAAIVLDPPAGGALTQTHQIAAARVKRVIYVSCDPLCLTRDAAILRQAGYQLHAATAIDQFIGSPRVESVCVFSR